ncbi:MAG: nuclear transport factor 2 family protein [Candidatus Cybelea sp.]|jgi:ketosteroid isomerase-like protein
MTSTHVEIDNIDRVKKGFEAFAASNMATLSELFDADAKWRGEPIGILAGNYDGRDAIFAMFAQLGQETTGTFRTIPSTMAASGDKVFVQCDVTGDRKGRKLKAAEVLIFTLADGRVRELRVYHAEPAQSAAFWA